jgi:hypothetical protein
MPNALDRFRLDGQVAVVTGGARGIGRAAAEALVAAGAHAVVVDRDPQETEKAAAEIGNAEAQTLDVTSEACVDRFFDSLAGRTGRIDILVNNAGASIRKPSVELSKAEWDGSRTATSSNNAMPGAPKQKPRQSPGLESHPPKGSGVATLRARTSSSGRHARGLPLTSS